jgi:hypothetical protein
VPWSGAVSALIGAIVGGLFTAVASSWQLRKVFDHERRMRDEQYYRAAAADISAVMSDFAEAMDELAFDHATCKLIGAECSRHKLSKQVRDAARSVVRSGHRYWDLWCESEAMEAAYTLASALLYEDVGSGPILTGLISEAYETAPPPGRETACCYGVLASSLGSSIATRAMNEFRREIWSGMDLPPKHSDE